MDFGALYKVTYRRRVGVFKTTKHSVTAYGMKLSINQQGLKDWNGGNVLIEDIISLERKKNNNRLIGLFYRLLLKIRGLK